MIVKIDFLAFNSVIEDKIGNFCLFLFVRCNIKYYCFNSKKSQKIKIIGIIKKKDGLKSRNAICFQSYDRHFNLYVFEYHFCFGVYHTVLAYSSDIVDIVKCTFGTLYAQSFTGSGFASVVYR